MHWQLENPISNIHARIPAKSLLRTICCRRFCTWPRKASSQTQVPSPRGSEKLENHLDTGENWTLKSKKYVLFNHVHQRHSYTRTYFEFHFMRNSSSESFAPWENVLSLYPHIASIKKKQIPRTNAVKSAVFWGGLASSPFKLESISEAW